MDDTELPKIALYGEPIHGKRSPDEKRKGVNIK